MKELQRQEQALTEEHEQKLTAIKDQAETERNQRLLAAESQSLNSIANGLTQSIMGHETWSKMIIQFGNEAVEGFIKNSIMILAQQDKDKIGNAKDAAGSAYSSVSKIPLIGPYLAPVAAATAFSAVMAFNQGTDRVPGVGNTDTVPTMLTPGEGVVSGGVMDGLRKIAANGGFDQQRPTHHVVMHNSFNVNTIDANGMEDALDKHADLLEARFQKSLRRMNK